MSAHSTNMHDDTMDLVSRLKAADEAFALATVVRTVSVTAAKAGAKAVIHPDGRIMAGWIGGGCARGAVLKAARAAPAHGEPSLVSGPPQTLPTHPAPHHPANTTPGR